MSTAEPVRADGVPLLDTASMARFVARGFLSFPALVPDDINEQFVREVSSRGVPEVAAGTPTDRAYDPSSAVGRMMALPEVQGIVRSLVGPGSLVDHHFVHMTLGGPDLHALGLPRAPAQHWHQDSTIDPRLTFDVQLMWFPHDVTPDMGGTRFLPGSHLRVVSEAAVGRYQNIVGQKQFSGPAGSLLALHMGIWHGAGANRSDRTRHMFKVRLNPTVAQVRLWDTSDLTDDLHEQRPIFFVTSKRDGTHLHDVLCRPEPWFEVDTSRLEYLNRIRLWRHLLGDDTFDADYWLTRVENEPARS